jgi:hypothetical protein
VPPGCRLPSPVPRYAALCRHMPAIRAQVIDLPRTHRLLPTWGSPVRARPRAPGNTKARSQWGSGLSCSGDGWRIARPFISACSPSTAPPSSPSPRPAAASARVRGATRCRLPRSRTRRGRRGLDPSVGERDVILLVV